MSIKTLYDEIELLRKVADGDHRAFHVLYEFYYPRIYAFSLRLLKSEILAEEVVQETFLKFWMRGYELRTIINLEAFLVAITRNRSLDLLRRAKLEVNVTQDYGKRWAESHNETEEGIILKETRKILQKTVDLLPPQQKLVYELCHQEGLKYQEVAERLNLSVLTVQSYMKLALKNIRKQMSQHVGTVFVLVISVILRIR